MRGPATSVYNRTFRFILLKAVRLLSHWTRNLFRFGSRDKCKRRHCYRRITGIGNWEEDFMHPANFVRAMASLEVSHEDERTAGLNHKREGKRQRPPLVSSFSAGLCLSVLALFIPLNSPAQALKGAI